MVRKKIVMFVLVLAMVCAGALPAIAGRGGGGFGLMASGIVAPGLRGLNGLDLTEEQKTEVAAILNYYQEDMTAAVDELLAAKEALAEAMWACDGETDVGAAYDVVAAREKAVVLLQAQINCEVKAILTDEQIEILDERRAARMERIRERLEAMQTTLDEWIDSYLSI
jgi:Spy/CpxP family protein refolding chaperone